MKDQFIVACREYFVKERVKTRHPRKIRETLKPDAIAPHLKQLGTSLVRCGRIHKPIHIPALNGADWDHVLSTLELSRAYA
ncbi:hypothetical protein [Enterobacter hormaechei]|uniref:hypothetical protein n=1 Tax=Enterobacter hormaechei TaxID=158836 RepID=UPI000BBA5F16|nr:hypothetical protein [Enterobacter hormaechei]